MDTASDTKRLLNAFSIDVEDYYHVTAFELHLDRSNWDDIPCRVVDSTYRLLDLLDERGVSATCYILGYVAQKHPRLVEDIARRGHEIGCHSYWHHLVYNLAPDEFRKDTRQAKDLLQQITGEEVLLYRAPSFSITPRSLWSLEILVEEGFTIDSSIYPVHHDRYGHPDAPREIHRIATPAGGLWEFPPAAYHLGRARIPISGGGYFRLLPLPLLSLLLKAEEAAGRPFVFYIHPWEIDPKQPKLKGIGACNRFRHYVNLRRTEEKLRTLLKSFRFSTVTDAVGQAAQTSNTIPSEPLVA